MSEHPFPSMPHMRFVDMNGGRLNIHDMRKIDENVLLVTLDTSDADVRFQIITLTDQVKALTEEVKALRSEIYRRKKDDIMEVIKGMRCVTCNHEGNLHSVAAMGYPPSCTITGCRCLRWVAP